MIELQHGGTTPRQHTILLTVDVEDWFQVENFKRCIPFSSWPDCELRIEKNVRRILDLLDSINCSTPSPQRRSAAAANNSITPSRINSSRKCGETKTQNLTLSTHNSPKATFFVLGWIAERIPHLVREIRSRGHEVASHGFYHELCREQSSLDLRNDLERSKKLLEDIAGTPVYGYRAPSFSIDHHILRRIKDAGYLYDSSFNSFGLNKRYGKLTFTGKGRNGISFQISDTFFELPISNLKIRDRVVPWGGGGYFRLIPLPLFLNGVKSILRKVGAYLFYIHPWEIDPDQPKVAGIQASYKFRHYINLHKTFTKLSYLLEHLKGCHFQTCSQYIQDE